MLKRNDKNSNKSFLIIKKVSVGSNRINTQSEVSIKILLGLISVVTMFCMTMTVSQSFGLFDDTPAGIYNCELKGKDLFEFLAAAVIGCIVICTASGLKKHSLKITLALLGAEIIFFGYHYKLVANGFVHALNKAYRSIIISQGQELNTYYLTPFAAVNPKLEMRYFCLTVIWCTCFVIAVAVIRHCNPVILTALVAFYAAPPLAFNVFVGEKYLIVASACCIAVFAVRASGYSFFYSNVRTSRFSNLLNVGGRNVSAAAFQQGTAALLCLTISLLAISSVYDSSQYKRNENVEQLSKDISKTIGDIGSGNFAVFSSFSSGELNNGNIYRSGDIVYSGKTMFKLKTDFQTGSAIYLRSYTAADFDGKRWSELSDKTYRQYDSMWTSFKENNFLPQFLYGGLLSITSPDRRLLRLDIINEEINRKIFLTSPALYPDKSDDLSLGKTNYDKAYRANSLSGIDSYTQSIISVLPSNTNVYLEYGMIGDTVYDTLYNGDFYISLYSSVFYDDEEKFSNYWDTFNKFCENEKQYRQFVMDNYLSYPEIIDDIFPKSVDLQQVYENLSVIEDAYSYYTDENGNEYFGSNENVENPWVVENYYSNVIEVIGEYLEENTEYTLSPGTTPYGEDFVDYFINENHKGYCVHYATAATLMLRKAGIPARYVEGYYISGSDLAETDSNGYVTVPDSRAHAWTEVYYPLTGWTVVDFTPSYGPDGEVPEENDSWKNSSAADTEAEVETDTEADIETDTLNESETDTSSERSTDISKSSDTDKNDESNVDSERSGKILSAVKNTFAVILTLFSIIAVWAVVRLIVKKITYMKFNSGDRRKAAKALYLYSLRLLAILSLTPKKNEGELEFARRAGLECELIDTDEFEIFTEQALSSKFSKDSPGRKDIEDMISFVEKLSDKIYGASNFGKRFAIKYIFFIC